MGVPATVGLVGLVVVQLVLCVEIFSKPNPLSVTSESSSGFVPECDGFSMSMNAIE